uniref:RRM domain-containing protein n=1 Tax=Gongylonema pulchrum TaxID=637853 RepID=A0A183EY48_9BILA
LEEKFGPIDEMNVCDNIGEHMIGNVYVKFENEEDADKCVKGLDNRWLRFFL